MCLPSWSCPAGPSRADRRAWESACRGVQAVPEYLISVRIAMAIPVQGEADRGMPGPWEPAAVSDLRPAGGLVVPPARRCRSLARTPAACHPSHHSLPRERHGRRGRPQATVCVNEGEVDQACQLGVQALQLLSEVEYETGVQRVRDLRTKLRPWPDHPAVAELTEQLLLVS
jgi:hypothetical protein